VWSYTSTYRLCFHGTERENFTFTVPSYYKNNAFHILELLPFLLFQLRQAVGSCLEMLPTYKRAGRGIQVPKTCILFGIPDDGQNPETQ
jgi:hypothetical protein